MLATRIKSGIVKSGIKLLVAYQIERTKTRFAHRVLAVVFNEVLLSTIGFKSKNQ